MVDERDIHNKRRAVERILERVDESSKISQENAELIKGFNEHLEAVRSIKIDRRYYYLIRISKVAQWVSRAFEEMDREDVKELQARIEQEDYSEWTKHDYLLTLKKFFRWINRDEMENYSWKSQEYPDIVKNIDTSVGKDANKLPKNLPEKEKVKRMIDECKNSRDKAILMTLFDGGFRVGEFLNMKVGHLNQMDRGVSVVVHGKTGSRQVLMPMAEPYLNKWLENHPDSSDDNYLWVNVSNYNYGEPLSYQCLRKRLRILRDRANLSCKVNPHAFRKASATFYAQHLNEVQMCDRYGWVYGSEMPRIYIKKSGKRTNNAVLKAHGMEVEEEKKEQDLKPKTCNRCGSSNPHDAERCRKCGLLLDRSKVTEEQISKENLESELVEMIEKNPDKWGSVFLNALEKSKAES